jgi:hypothetical protein
MSETRTYTIKVNFEQRGCSDVHFEDFKKEIKDRLAGTLPAQKGEASAQLESIKEKKI